jgi:hypothetical protein
MDVLVPDAWYAQLAAVPPERPQVLLEMDSRPQPVRYGYRNGVEGDVGALAALSEVYEDLERPVVDLVNGDIHRAATARYPVCEAPEGFRPLLHLRHVYPYSTGILFFWVAIRIGWPCYYFFALDRLHWKRGSPFSPHK